MPNEEINNCIICGSKSECFNMLKSDELDEANHKRTQITYLKGEMIAKQGIFYTHVLYIQKGMVKIYREIGDGSRIILNFFTAGNLIGLPFLFKNEIFDYSVSAIEDTVICAIDRKTFEELVNENNAFAVSLLKTLNRCALYNYDRIVGLVHKQINGRFADTLIYLSNEIYGNNEFKLTLSRKDLAEYTGVSVMSLVRVIKDFKKDGIINIQGNQFKILKPDALKQISKTG